MIDHDADVGAPVVLAKQEWVVPQITAFAASVDAQGGSSDRTDDGGELNYS